MTWGEIRDLPLSVFWELVSHMPGLAAREDLRFINSVNSILSKDGKIHINDLVALANGKSGTIKARNDFWWENKSPKAERDRIKRHYLGG